MSLYVHGCPCVSLCHCVSLCVPEWIYIYICVSLYVHVCNFVSMCIPMSFKCTCVSLYVPVCLCVSIYVPVLLLDIWQQQVETLPCVPPKLIV